MDLFVCGVCRTQFNDILKFMEHKKSLPNSFTCVKCSSFFHLASELEEHEKIQCGKNGDNPKEKENSQSEKLTNIQIVYTTNEENQFNISDKSENENAPLILSIDNSNGNVGAQEEIQLETDSIFMCKMCNNLSFCEEDICKHLQDSHDKNIDKICTNLDEFVSKLIPVSTTEIEGEDNSEMKMTQTFVENGKIEVLVKNEKASTLKKKRGRPKKSANKEVDLTKPQNEVKEDEKKENDAIVDADGKVECTKCKKKFNKQRQFHGHKCWGKIADFVATSKREIEELEDDDEDDEQESDNDITLDYKVNLESNKRRKKQRKKSENLNEIVQEVKLNQKETENCQTNHEVNFVPVFNDDEERKNFEEKIKNVDLSCVDNLFTTHVVEQEVNQLVIKQNNKSDKVNLQMFSCTVCKKVFKTLSHMRLHCLTHTKLKPFKCTICGYSSNAKGNLYTHMRKHTGNLFSCSICDFKSCNRSHVSEHEATHTKTRHVCRLCSNDYNTTKSLINHVRKYHNITQEGRDYLNSFMLKTNQAAAVLFQCHICNRKFKKKVDRDRHVLIHQLQRKQMKCDLCFYTTKRRINFENHFQKHRIVFTCCQCRKRVSSSVLLQEHLQSHVEISNEQVNNETNDQNSFSALFEASINLSFYLPEPQNQENKFNYANIPQELMEEGGNEVQRCNDGKGKQNEFNTENMITSLRYKQMNMEIYNKIRESFGNEECRVCGRLFHVKGDCEIHLKSHSQEKSFTCTKCKYCSRSKENLNRHMQTVHEKRKFLCDKCGFTAYSKTSMWHHQQKHREVAKECPECKKMCGNNRKLESHLICAHPQLSRKEIIEIVGLNKRQQGKIGKRSYKCPYCQKIFHRSNTDLKKHIWIHQGIKPFKCPLCPYACRSRNNLNVHLLSHSNNKPHLCQQCGKAYKSKTALKWHLQSHSTVNIFSCTYCDYKANQKSHLKRHIEIHEISKKYKCNYCKYSANTLAYIKVHHTRKHKSESFKLQQVPDEGTTTTNSKAFNCVSCEYLFGNLSDLKRHLKVRHQMNLVDLKDIGYIDTQINQNESILNTEENENYQLVQVETDDGTILAPVAASALAGLEMTNVEMDETTASAVTIIQQLIEQNSFTTNSKQLIAINPQQTN